MAAWHSRFHLRNKLYLSLALIVGGFGLFSVVLFLNVDRVVLESHAKRQIRETAERLLQLPPERRAAAVHAAGIEAFVWEERHSLQLSERWRVSEKSPVWVDFPGRRLQMWGRDAGVTWAAEMSLSGVAGVLQETARFLLLATFLNTFAAILAAGLWLRGLVIRPLARLSEAMAGVGAKVAQFRPLPVQARDEIGQLTLSFNALMERLQEAEGANARYTSKLEAAYRSLEEAQERVITSEKLASLGRLSAGIAHEVGNPLAAIQGYLSLLPRLGPEEKAEFEEAVARAAKEAARIDRIIRGLLDFARPHAGEEQARPAAEVLSELQESLASQPLFKEVRLQVSASPDTGLIPTAGGRLEQVLVNLCINAADAMQGRGEISLGAQRDGDAVVLTVRDTGEGISKEDIAHIFEPFYTTKPPEKGTGLGLAISHQIVTALRGTVTAQSEKGVGTTFEIRLPGVTIPPGPPGGGLGLPPS